MVFGIKLGVVWKKKKKRDFQPLDIFFFFSAGLLNLSSGGVTFRASLAASCDFLLASIRVPQYGTVQDTGRAGTKPSLKASQRYPWLRMGKSLLAVSGRLESLKLLDENLQPRLSQVSRLPNCRPTNLSQRGCDAKPAALKFSRGGGRRRMSACFLLFPFQLGRSREWPQ